MIVHKSYTILTLSLLDIWIATGYLMHLVLKFKYLSHLNFIHHLKSVSKRCTNLANMFVCYQLGYFKRTCLITGYIVVQKITLFVTLPTMFHMRKHYFPKTNYCTNNIWQCKWLRAFVPVFIVKFKNERTSATKYHSLERIEWLLNFAMCLLI